MFSGYKSFRDTMTQQLATFLKTGADPESPSNPDNENNLSRLVGTLVNFKKEFKIGNTFVVFLPNRDVIIKNNRVDILNYIRKNGNIPFNQPLANEPINGFPKSIAPPPVDTNIIVNPTNLVGMPNGCGGGVNGQLNPKTGRYAFGFGSVQDSSLGNYYYWDFGDGYVSYQANPTHAYKANSGLYRVTGTIYNSYGAPCGGSGGSNGGNTNIGTGNGNNTPSGCTSLSGGSVNPTSNGFNANFTINPPMGQTFNTFIWDFGDNSALFTGSSTTEPHTYSQGTYIVTVKSTDVTRGYCFVASCSIVINTPYTPPPPCCPFDQYTFLYCHNSDYSHKAKHSFTGKHLAGTISASIAPLVRVRTIFGVQIYWFSFDITYVDVMGFYDTFNTNTNSNCGTQNTLNAVGTFNNQNALWNTADAVHGVGNIYFETNGANSTGAYYSTNFLQTTCH